MLNVFLENKRGFLAVLGAFLINLCTGIYNGTFGNILTYLTSYLRQSRPELTDGDLTMIFTVGGASQGISYLLGGLIIVPLLGNRMSLIVGCLVRALAPLLTYFALDSSVAFLSLTYGLLNGVSNNI